MMLKGNRVPYDEVAQIVKRDAEKLKEYELGDVIDPYNKERELKPTQCFVTSMDYVACIYFYNDPIDYADEEYKLCHGLYYCEELGCYAPHGWVEFICKDFIEDRTVVYDGVLDEFYDIDVYYNYYKIRKLAEYSPSQAVAMGDANGTSGPWISDLL